MAHQHWRGRVTRFPLTPFGQLVAGIGIGAVVGTLLGLRLLTHGGLW